MSSNYSAFYALRFRDLRLFLIGLLISFTGTQMQTVALAWHLYQITNSPVSLGVMGIVGFVPFMLFGLFGGVIVDTFSRKHILLVTQSLLFVTAFLLWILTISHHITPLAIYILLFLSAVVSSVDSPVRSSVIPSLAPPEHLKGAVNLLTLTRQIAFMAGPMFVGFLIALYGPQSAYFLNAASFLFLFIIVLFIHVPYTPPEKRSVIDIEAMKDGIRFIISTPLIYSTMLLDFFVTFFGSATVLLPVFAKSILHAPVQELGILYAAPAIGSILAGIFVSSLKKMHSPGKVLLIAVTVFGLATIGFGFSRWIILSIIFLIFIGGSDTVSTMIRNVIRQSLTPDSMRGRMGGMVMIFFIGGPFLGDAEAGFIAGAIGAPLSVITGGIGAVLATIAIWKIFPQIIKYKD